MYIYTHMYIYKIYNIHSIYIFYTYTYVSIIYIKYTLSSKINCTENIV